jgi:oligopeptide transport system ATP-binding protein
MSLLHVENLQVRFDTPEGVVNAVNGINLTLDEGKSLGIVGESGSGKSQMALAVMGLLARNAKVSGSVKFEHQELIGLPGNAMSGLRGSHISMIFQDPMTCLNPYLRIGTQMAEVLVQHRGMDWQQAEADCIRMLDAVKMPDANTRLRQYPHEFSGGQRQRVMIAMALLCRPKLLIADEPTTALDVTIQAQILDLLDELRREFGLALLLITHDLGIVAEVCDQALVMYAGQVMEYGPTPLLLTRPTHPYTQGLLHSRPRLDLPLESELFSIAGQPPDALHRPTGCPFMPRCAHAFAACETAPDLQAWQGVSRACHLQSS